MSYYLQQHTPNWRPMLMCHHGCTVSETATNLTPEILLAAREGNVDVIQEYIDKPHDLNATYEGESLLSTACAAGQGEIVKRLIHQRPNLHLNTTHEGKTPLQLAAENGHLECVRLLLDSPTECNVRLDSCWQAVEDVLKLNPRLSQRSTVVILGWARREGQWNAVSLLLQTDVYIKKEDIRHVAMQAIDRNHWEIVPLVLQRDFYNKENFTIEIFGVLVHLKRWENAHEILRMIDEKLTFDVPFVETAIAGRTEAVQRLLEYQQYDCHTLCGNLLVVAAGGISGPVADLLMAIKNTYTRKVLSDALHLAGQGHRAEIFSRLLCNTEASYSIHDLCRTKRAITRSYPKRFEEFELLVQYFKNKF